MKNYLNKLKKIGQSISFEKTKKEDIRQKLADYANTCATNEYQLPETNIASSANDLKTESN